MTQSPIAQNLKPGVARSGREFEPPLLEIFWGKGEAAKALYREVQEIIARKYGPAAVANSTKPAKPARKPRTPPPDGLKTAAQAAAKLGCSIKTLNGHVASGALKYVSIGHGTKRPRKMFTDADLDEFIANQTRKDSPCLSDATRAPRSGSTISRSEVIAFTARPNARTGAKRKR